MISNIGYSLFEVRSCYLNKFCHSIDQYKHLLFSRFNFPLHINFLPKSVNHHLNQRKLFWCHIYYMTAYKKESDIVIVWYFYLILLSLSDNVSHDIVVAWYCHCIILLLYYIVIALYCNFIILSLHDIVNTLYCNFSTHCFLPTSGSPRFSWALIFYPLEYVKQLFQCIIWVCFLRSCFKISSPKRLCLDY